MTFHSYVKLPEGSAKASKASKASKATAIFHLKQHIDLSSPAQVEEVHPEPENWEELGDDEPSATWIAWAAGMYNQQIGMNQPTSGFTPLAWGHEDRTNRVVVCENGENCIKQILKMMITH